MTAMLIRPAAQICTFALGCALIHAARAHAVLLSSILSWIAALMAALVVLGACLVLLPEDVGRFDEVTVFAAATGQPFAAETDPGRAR